MPELKTNREEVLTKSTTIDISVVVPLLNEEQSLKELFDKIVDAVQNYSFEIIFVDDGSTDGS